MLLIVILIILIPIFFSRKKGQCSDYHTTKAPPKYAKATHERPNTFPAASVASDVLPYDKVYQKKWLLTMNEKAFYRQLNGYAARKDMTVFTKVRLLDLLEPMKNQPKYKTYFYKVQAKHVDFVLCDTKLVARYIIELDDSSHNTPDRVERDQFVDTVLQAVGYKVLRLKSFDEVKIEQGFFQSTT